MTSTEKKEKLNRAIELLKLGFTQKEISKAINVSEQSLVKWLKSPKENLTLQAKNRKLLDKQLNKLLNSETPNVKEISLLTKAMNEYKSLE